MLGPDHPDTLTTRHEIADVMADRGDHAGAEAEYRDVLAARLRVLGPDHPARWPPGTRSPGVMAARGDHAGAEAEFRDVLAVEVRVLGADHPSTLATRHDIACEMADRGGPRRGRSRIRRRAGRRMFGCWAPTTRHVESPS